ARAAQAIGCGRVDIWLFDETETELRAVDLHDAAAGTHRSGETLRESEYKGGFEALKKGPFLVSDDIAADASAARLAAAYPEGARLKATLDAVVLVGGRHLGLLRFAHLDKP